MAVAQLQIPADNINALVPQSTWASLSNLGNVYQQAQAQRAKQAALASLGTDPKANLQTLLQSQDPQLAQLGLSLQEKGVEQSREDARYKITDARADAELAMRKAAEARAQGNYDEAEKWQRQVPGLIASLQGGAAPTAAPTAAPFPAPLPGASAPLASLNPQPSPTAPPPAPSAFAASPPVPAALQPPAVAPPPPQSSAVPQQPVASPPAEAPPVQGQPAPPVKAEGDEPSALPGWLQSAQAQPPDTSVAARVTSNLTSGQPAAAAGISREQIGALIQNPLTRQLGVTFLQNQLDPGTWKVEKLDDGSGRVMAFNTKTMQSKDITPPTPEGGAPSSKEEREAQGWYKAGIGLRNEPR